MSSVGIVLVAIIFNTVILGQTIEYKKNIADSVRYGIEINVKGAYDSENKSILLSTDWIDASSIRVFLHELGHHVWFYGGVDTTAILNSLVGEYILHDEVLEMFAEQHVKYFFGEASVAFRNIFYNFYNKMEKYK